MKLNVTLLLELLNLNVELSSNGDFEIEQYVSFLKKYDREKLYTLLTRLRDLKITDIIYEEKEEYFGKTSIFKDLSEIRVFTDGEIRYGILENNNCDIIIRNFNWIVILNHSIYKPNAEILVRNIDFDIEKLPSYKDMTSDNYYEGMDIPRIKTQTNFIDILVELEQAKLELSKRINQVLDKVTPNSFNEQHALTTVRSDILVLTRSIDTLKEYVEENARLYMDDGEIKSAKEKRKEFKKNN